ncbi:bifunctional [glutamine synthetase] adenylyltransferase/[glutamine synthetase]-adenylyl-L-tyrosine phosphorylase [Paenochrobactrum sp. BZR 588]|uniref:bifunctional [glutamine synthetase] adenylyltransferase/[glutamine synthetase]-adenylyl-L-tyrosine phosphorylase n=1 Tax=unclassified Paenochrobactrum TaxID=2639760 RepID=UPI00385307EB
MVSDTAGHLFFHRITHVLTPFDEQIAQKYLVALRRRAQDENISGLTALLSNESAAGFLSSVLELSPYIREYLLRHPQLLAQLNETSPELILADIFADLKLCGSGAGETENSLMAGLRRGKNAAHILIALCDLAGIFNTPTTTQWITDLAETCLGAAVRFLLRDTASKGKITLSDPENPEKDCGWIILAMGKFGAFELNYSSDIDLIILIDEQSPYIGDPYECVDIFSRLARRLLRIMQERTVDGYVFRTDLRLRPDPGSTPLAIPFGFALHYYEGRGQNWERAAMIKARPVAGDIKAGKAFLLELSPYIWRKYLDYAAIADVHSIKRQIHVHKGHGIIAIHGHNVKLGRGGIREIEFFVQTQQLIAGGRFPQLRGAQTVEMLKTLAEFGWITLQARDDLTKQYSFLRDIEHRIQMVNDEQNHTLPEDDEGLAGIAHLMGYQQLQDFTKDLLHCLKTVERHYAVLFEKAAELGNDAGNLVFTGEGDDPGTIETLTKMGFERPSDICRIIRGWHFGRYRATQSAEARERLTELTPALLHAFAETKQADDTLVRFDSFLQGLPAGIQLFSLLQSNPRLLNLLVLVMSVAPRMADIITRKPHIFDGLLDPAIFAEMPTLSYLETRLNAFLGNNDHYEEILDRLRIFAAEHRFLIGIRMLTGAIDGVRAGKAFSDLAELMVARALQAVEAEFCRRHGRVAGGKTAILAMGKLGSRELTSGSDVDLILLYDHPEDVEYSDGEKPLAVSQYYMRMTQRLVAALSAPTAEGILYQVDLRLRPSGNKGPVATHVSSFDKYQRQEAWTWEHMALTRARPISGDQMLMTRVEATIEDVLALPRDGLKIAQDVREMRKLIEEEKPARNIWDFKLKKGGMLDLEFIAQYAALTGQVSVKTCGKSTDEILSALKPIFANADMSEKLTAICRFYTNMSQTIRLCSGDDFNPEQFLPGMIELLCQVSQLPDLRVLEYQLDEYSADTRAAFMQLV